MACKLATLFGHSSLSQVIIDHGYGGSGTIEDPHLVNWLPEDVENPMNFREITKWSLNALVALSAFIIALASSAFSGGLVEIISTFTISKEVAILGLSLYVIGFAIGPLLWAPLSEKYGRRYVFIVSGATLTILLAGTAGAHNIETLLILRFLAGSLGSAPLITAGGVIADLFPPLSRGLALGLYVLAPFLGPSVGPIVGGFISEAGGWRWVQGFLALLSALQWLVTVLLLPETYPPVLLRRRAEHLSKITGRTYRSTLDLNKVNVSLKVTLSRPWVLLFKEPIVLLITIYMSIIYGTLYMLFAAYPIVFQQTRGWSEGLGGLSFLGVMVGILLSVPSMYLGHLRYKKLASKAQTRLSPETRLPDCFLASIALPIGLFWFAWTNSPSVHWIVPILAGVPFGFGCIMLFLPCLNYLVDSYTIYAASVLAANSAMRSIFGAVFPLFADKMYENLGLHWAASVPAFLALACVPIPYLFFIYGARIRRRCHYAAEADDFMNKLLGITSQPSSGSMDRQSSGMEK
jgi:multidrug resistance protein